jgi:hypothetical protein
MPFGPSVREYVRDQGNRSYPRDATPALRLAEIVDKNQPITPTQRVE